MARKVVLVSDISGKEADESEFTKLVVRSGHPAADEPKQLDVLAEEVATLKGADNLVTLEIGDNGNKREIVIPLADFRKIVDDKVVHAAAGTRGRRAGWSPNNR